MAESVASDTLSATTWVFCVFSSFTTSNIAPTLLGRNTENCFTSGPSIFEVVSGKLTVIWIMTPRPTLMGASQGVSHFQSSVGKPISSNASTRYGDCSFCTSSLYCRNDCGSACSSLQQGPGDRSSVL